MAEVKEPIEVKKKRKRIQLLDSDSGSDEEYRPDSTGNFFKIISSMIVFKHEFISMPLDVTFSLSFLTLLEIFHPFLTLLEIFIPLLTLHEIYLPNTPEPRYSKRARQTPFVYYIKSFIISRHSKK